MKTVFNNPDFYPTSVSVMNMMGIDCYEKIVLEPQAGKCDIVDYLKEHRSKEVLTCEINKDLAEIVKTKSKFLKHDFFKVKAEEISHVQLIVMNPPFSNGAKHILRAWEIAPDGCEIISLINFQTIGNTWSSDRQELMQIIRDYGTSQNLGNVFSDAERETDVEVGLIKLYKPRRDGNEFDGFFMEDEQEAQGTGIMPFNAVRDVVQRYVHSVQCFEEHEAINKKMNSLTNLFDVGGFSFYIGHNNAVSTKEDFKKELQKKAWKYLFDKMNMKKYVTSGVMKDINSFVENQTKVPFTMKNVYKMFEIIVGTREQTFNKSLVEAIDHFTKHTHENRYAIEGWKTNAGYLLNKKIIVPYIIEKGWSGEMGVRHSGYQDNITDLMKVICSLTGKNYDDYISLYDQLRYRYKIYKNGKLYLSFGDSKSELESMESTKKKLYEEGIPFTVDDSPAEFGKWIDWGFFEVKGFKKGTLHMKFKDDKVWEIINRTYGKIKGQVLPECI